MLCEVGGEMGTIIAIVLLVILVVWIASIIWPVLLIALVALLAFYIGTNAYFRSEKFLSIKDRISQYIKDSNELNDHIESLRSSFQDYKKKDYGEATFTNTSQYHYSKAKLNNLKYASNIYDCSRTVCDNARKQPFKYICKYFGIKTDEKTLEDLEAVLNNFSAAEEGKELLIKQKNEILDSISNDVPAIIRKFRKKKLEEKLGFKPFSYNEIYYPTFTFRYTSAGGKSGTKYDVTLDVPMLERFVNYIAEKVKFKKSAVGQRRLMTPALRRYIIERDHHTCQLCGNSTAKEPNLLLEVDHIIPIAKGGMTTVDNLQTLCWKCNRSKGAKIIKEE